MADRSASAGCASDVSAGRALVGPRPPISASSSDAFDRDLDLEAEVGPSPTASSVRRSSARAAL
jgi:hypothetical protein